MELLDLRVPMASSTLDGPSLFSVRERTDDRPRAHQEPSYAFLDRAAGLPWHATRTALDAWYLRLPAAARADVRNRFAQDDELDHAGAFWELWVHEAHRRLGFAVTVNIGTEGGARRQDFVIEQAGRRCWLEATVVGGDSPLTFTEQRLDEQLCDLLETVRAPRFSLGLEVCRYGTSTPGRRQVVPPLERWLGALDANELRARRAAGAAPPIHRLEFDDWQIELEAIAVEAPCHGRRPMLAPRGARDGRVDDVRPLRRKIKKKAARYGALDRPYLLAVLALGDFVGDHDVAGALLGTPARGGHAVWIGPGGPHNTRLSGVLVARGLQSTSPPAAPPTLWRNPWALRPLELPLPWRAAQPADDGVTFSAPRAGASGIFGLPTRPCATPARARPSRAARGHRPFAPRPVVALAP